MGVGICFFVVFPFCINLVIATKIKAFVALNATAAAYFESNSRLFISLCIVSGSASSSLQLLSSRLFNVGVFNCGLTKYELRQLSSLKVFGNVLTEVPYIYILYVHIYTLT